MGGMSRRGSAKPGSGAVPCATRLGAGVGAVAGDGVATTALGGSAPTVWGLFAANMEPAAPEPLRSSAVSLPGFRAGGIRLAPALVGRGPGGSDEFEAGAGSKAVALPDCRAPF